MRLRIFLALWALAAVAGAFALRAFGAPPGILRALANSEPAHIVAHLVLYGVLAHASLSAFPRPRWLAPAVTMGVALAQELAQVAPFGGAIGWAGTFDLTVDALALCGAIGLRRALTPVATA